MYLVSSKSPLYFLEELCIKVLFFSIFVTGKILKVFFLPKETLLDTTLLLRSILFIEIDILYWYFFVLQFQYTKFYNCFFPFLYMLSSFYMFFQVIFSHFFSFQLEFSVNLRL